jgi:hypothetical protein
MKPLITDRQQWEVLETFLAAKRERLVSKIINCSTEDLKHLQGQIFLLDEILKLPHQLKQEEGTKR